jgi:hypothetical protein
MRRLILTFSLIAAAFVAGVIVTTAAQAGMGEDNMYISLHFNPGDTAPVYETRLHRGSESLDTVSPEYGTSDFYALRSAAFEGQAEFDAAANNVYGATWYGQSAMTATRKQTMRDAFQFVCQ